MGIFHQLVVEVIDLIVLVSMAAKKGIGSFLKAQASSKIKATTEEELKVKGVSNISPDDVLGLSKPTKSLLNTTLDC